MTETLDTSEAEALELTENAIAIKGHLETLCDPQNMASINSLVDESADDKTRKPWSLSVAGIRFEPNNITTSKGLKMSFGSSPKITYGSKLATVTINDELGDLGNLASLMDEDGVTSEQLQEVINEVAIRTQRSLDETPLAFERAVKELIAKRRELLA